LADILDIEAPRSRTSRNLQRRVWFYFKFTR